MLDGLFRIYLNVKVSLIGRDLKRLVREVATEEFRVRQSGDDKDLVYDVCVVSDAEKQRLASDSQLSARLSALPARYRYPRKARLHIEFQSQETIDREYDGKWHYYFA